MLTKEISRTDHVDPRVTRTRHLLVKAFNELLKEKSFEAITVQDIAERATVNRATFYAHFDDKYALFDQVAQESFKQALSGQLPPHAGLDASTLHMLIQVVCEYLEWHSAHCKPSIRTQFGAQLEDQVKRQMRELLLAWLKSAVLKGAASASDLELRAAVASWAIYGAAMFWIDASGKEPAPEFAGRAVPLVMAGLQVKAPKIASR